MNLSYHPPKEHWKKLLIRQRQILQMRLRMDLPQDKDPVPQDALILADTVWAGVSTVGKFVLLGRVQHLHTE